MASIDQIPIDHLQPNPLQPRGSIRPDTLEDLVNSIKKHGILEPLVIAQTPAGLQIIAGPFQEEKIFRVAYTFEQNTEHHLQKPKL